MIGVTDCWSPWRGFRSGFALFTLHEPEKGANESSHILKESGMDLQTQQEKAPRVLLGSAGTRLLRIRSMYYELVAVAILGFVGTGSGLFGNLFLIDKFHLDTAGRSDIYAIVGLAHIPRPPVGLCVRRPVLPAIPPAAHWSFRASASAGYGAFLCRLAVRAELWLVIRAADLGHRRHVAVGHLHFHDVGRHRPTGNENDLLRLVRGRFAGLRGLRRIGHRRCGLGCDRRPARARGLAVGHRARVRHRRFPPDPRLASVNRDITLVIESVIERYTEGKRRQGGGEIPAFQVHDLDFYYGTNQVLFDLNLEVEEGRWWPCSEPTVPASPHCCGRCRAFRIHTAG